MKYLKLFLLTLPVLGFGQKIIFDDIINFWKAYDKVIIEKDSAKQISLIKDLYINKATPGLNGIMKARNYSAEEYVFAISQYPKFWKSIRTNTLKSNQFSKEIQNGIEKLKTIYPVLKPVDTYFEIGILRTGGTTIDGMLLIGSEVALADQSVITEEFDERYPHLRSYFNTNPINDVVFLNVHEYIHTQQKETIGNTLLSQTIMEGVAEFLAEIALNEKSPNPQIAFGYKNEEKIKREFEKEMFSSNIYNWLMNTPDNQFRMRDLGYFVGYAICKKYYEQSSDKKSAVKEMIQLDYNNESDLMNFVDRSKYFPKLLKLYKIEFEGNQPKVLSVSPIKNGSKNIKPGIIQYSINFSQEMDTNFRRFDYGPLGETAIYKFKKLIGWSNNNQTLTLEIEVEPNKKYQVLIADGAKGFKNKQGIVIKPYLFEFETGSK
ncbi:DUF2268 domain-containing putative Zn-dependent protease [Chryseobacterium sp. 3008163]|uniref:DUF2268 domain-containing putative Zn-dependent protease n=1 Tax=Chryseobacterium sp. 3008163 TaxID=2478663 RepID=UPI000F0C9E27|nr:DUF2268 domain-containing putative Zn-dependent protease [Chryseobacterium sp. 3008163]AYM99002.1 hypothetical protein EAG08_00380 [Chryseobacterium sp. 3008163]